MGNKKLLLSDIFESRLEEIACLKDSEKEELNESEEEISIDEYII